MKLYYTPVACSMAPHIALREAGLEFELVKVDLATKVTENGDDFNAINPKGYVPALELDNGEILTEVAAILQYIGDQKPGSGLTPEAGTMARYRLAEMLSFLSGELHKSFSPLFDPTTSDEARQAIAERIGRRFAYINEQLEGQDYIMGDTFSVADTYLNTILGWARHTQMDLSAWPNITAYADRIMARPAVQETFKAEGLM